MYDVDGRNGRSNEGNARLELVLHLATDGILESRALINWLFALRV